MHIVASKTKINTFFAFLDDDREIEITFKEGKTCVINDDVSIETEKKIREYFNDDRTTGL